MARAGTQGVDPRLVNTQDVLGYRGSLETVAPNSSIIKKQENIELRNEKISEGSVQKKRFAHLPRSFRA